MSSTVLADVLFPILVFTMTAEIFILSLCFLWHPRISIAHMKPLIGLSVLSSTLSTLMLVLFSTYYAYTLSLKLLCFILSLTTCVTCWIKLQKRLVKLACKVLKHNRLKLKYNSLRADQTSHPAIIDEMETIRSSSTEVLE